MRTIALFSCCLTLFLGCTSKPETGLLANECVWPGPQSDSALVDEFRNFLKIRHAPPPFIPQSDTVYRLHGRGGWGGFDYLCSVYYDTGGYKVSVTNLICPKLDGRCNFEERVRSIGFFEWQQIRSEFQKCNFWCDSLAYDDFICTDASEYALVAREGSKFRTVEWDDCETGIKPVRILAKKIRDLCGFPLAPGFASYSLKGDSVYADIYIGGLLESFTERIDFQYHEVPLPTKDGLGKVAWHKRDLDSLRKVLITEYGIDGSRRSVNVTRIAPEGYSPR